MALYDLVRGKIVRQELEAVIVGPHYTQYSAKVKYSPEHIKDPEFFNLCYSLFNQGDTVEILTTKNNKILAKYHFEIVDIDKEEKTVKAILVSEFNLEQGTTSYPGTLKEEGVECLTPAEILYGKEKQLNTKQPVANTATPTTSTKPPATNTKTPAGQATNKTTQNS